MLLLRVLRPPILLRPLPPGYTPHSQPIGAPTPNPGLGPPPSAPDSNARSGARAGSPSTAFCSRVPLHSVSRLVDELSGGLDERSARTCWRAAAGGTRCHAARSCPSPSSTPWFASSS